VGLFPQRGLTTRTATEDAMTDCASTPRCLVVIDDDASCRTTIACLLRKLGHTVETAETGSAGLALLRQKSVDLMMTDLTMPGLTGWDVARLAKTMHPLLPVVLVTGSAHTISPDKPERQFVDAILAKPCEAAAMQAVIGPLTRDLADATGSGSPERMGLTAMRGRPTSAAFLGTLPEASVTLRLDAQSHGRLVAGSAETEVATEGV
jgi:CheY-like chemotaxis protein